MEPIDFSNRYTQGAQRAIAEARTEALRQGRSCVMPIDLLVGMLQDKQRSSAARRALDILGIKAEAVCKKLDRIAAAPKGRMVNSQPIEPIPLSPDTKTAFKTDSNRVFAGATALAQADGASLIGTEHLLLALYDDSLFAPQVRAIMQDFGVKDSNDRRARDMIVEALAEAVRSRSA